MVKPRFHEAHLAAVRRALKNEADVREGGMFGYPAFFVGRRLFLCLYRSGAALKVPAERVAALLGNGAKRFQPYGKRRMREWIWIDLDKYRDQRKIFLESRDFVRGAERDRVLRAAKRKRR